MIIYDNAGTAEASSTSAIKAAYPSTSFRRDFPASQINPLGYFYREDRAKPAYDAATQKVIRGAVAVEESPGVWVDDWQVVPLTQEELDAIADREDAEAIKIDPQVKALILARPQGIENYIDNNVTNLASAKDVITILAKAISAIGKRQFR